jgi:hypothetical protein
MELNMTTLLALAGIAYVLLCPVAAETRPNDIDDRGLDACCPMGIIGDRSLVLEIPRQGVQKAH